MTPVLRPAPIDKPLCPHDRVVEERRLADRYTKQDCLDCGRTAYIDEWGNEHVSWPTNPLGLMSGGPA